MAWVRSEYAGELAVLSAWLSALMPWSVTVFRPDSSAITFVVVRYAYFTLQFLLNLTLPDERPFLWVFEVPDFVAPRVRPAATLALVAAGVFGLALALSVAYYLADERVEALPVDPARLMGGLLAACVLLYAPALAILWEHKVGLTVPVAPVFMIVFAAVLLRVDRT